MTPDSNAALAAVEFMHDRMVVRLVNGFRAKMALSRFPRLALASPGARENWRVTADKQAIEWPELSYSIGKTELLAH